jgi:hypothetical protein
MSKYKTGDKFVIEIGAERLGDPILYRIKGFNALMFDDNGLDRLERFDADAKANADYNSGYEDGLRDAWECVRHILRMEWKERHEAFNDPSWMLSEMLGHMTPDEAITKLKEYEAKKDEIKVGDIVRYNEKDGIVTFIKENQMYVMWEDGSAGDFIDAEKWFKKTGRHYDIDSILEQLKGADDEHDK